MFGSPPGRARLSVFTSLQKNVCILSYLKSNVPTLIGYMKVLKCLQFDADIMVHQLREEAQGNVIYHEMKTFLYIQYIFVIYKYHYHSPVSS